MRGFKNKTIIRIINHYIYKCCNYILAYCNRDIFILMFHNITCDVSTEEYSVSIEQFVNIIERLECSGFSFISMDELISGNYTKGKKCLITFDDVADGVYYYAYQYLQSKRIPFCLYVAPGLMGGKGYITENELIAMSKSELCTIGSHTLNHIMTRYATEEELEIELVQSKRILEDLTGNEVSHFAFPYGSPQAISIFDSEYVKRANYKSAVTTYQTKLPNNYLRNRFWLPRIDASRKDLMEIVIK